MSVAYIEQEAGLKETEKACYDNAAAFWERLKTQLASAAAETGVGGALMRSYWSAHQRFFKQLCTHSVERSSHATKLLDAPVAARGEAAGRLESAVRRAAATTCSSHATKRLGFTIAC